MRNILSGIAGCLLATSTPPPSSTIVRRSPQDLVATMKQTYSDLQSTGLLHHNATATLRFSFVPPPCSCPNANATASSLTSALTSESESESTGSPVLQDGLEITTDARKPIALYIPGLDGSGISAATYQFPDLSNTFQFWRLTILPEDRSSFGTIVSTITDFVVSFDQPVTLIGESCGGLLSAAVAIRLSSMRHPTTSQCNGTLQGLVLVNPATSFDETPWGDLVPMLASLDETPMKPDKEKDGTTLTPYAVLGSLLLSAIIPDAEQSRRIASTVVETITEAWSDRMPRDLYVALMDSFRNTREQLPAAVLQHRVSAWLVAGTAVVNARLSSIQVPVLVIAGQEDRLLPSAQEVIRLKKALPQTETLVVQARGHFVLDDTVNLTEAILYSKIDPLNFNQTKAKYDPITDWKLPTNLPEFYRMQVNPLKAAFSPVYFSTDAVTGKRWTGMCKLPKVEAGRPLLFVANHQLAGLDMTLFVSELLNERGILARGLAHPIAFMNRNTSSMGPDYGDLEGRVPGLRTSTASPASVFAGGFERYGAVLVTPRNYYRLLQTGQNALLFPGGVLEAQSGNKSYPLFWPDKVDFVRTAARFNATIVPLSAVGMIDSVNIIAELNDLANGPFARNLPSFNTTAARYDGRGRNETIGFPLLYPTWPARNYFLFGRPIDTALIDPSDKGACERAYNEAQESVRCGIDDLLIAREHDPFKSAPQRLAYEQGFGKKAPTFPVSYLNQ